MFRNSFRKSTRANLSATSETGINRNSNNQRTLNIKSALIKYFSEIKGPPKLIKYQNAIEKLIF